jgi:hypothetical protein
MRTTHRDDVPEDMIVNRSKFLRVNFNGGDGAGRLDI